ncbi:MAG: amidohydrolase family protein, partial [Beijerinckiaceae bacterium]
EAVDAGATGVTHLFNAMSQMLPRAPGLVGAALDEQRLYAGLICDGLHVDAMNMRVAFKAKGRDRLMLVTDAMPTAASDIRAFELSGRTIVLHEGRLTGPDGTLAGAHLTMIGAVQNAVAFMGVSLLDALIMASRTPAHCLGLEHSHGRIKPGFQADYVAFNDEFLVTDTWIGGDHQRH